MRLPAPMRAMTNRPGLDALTTGGSVAAVLLGLTLLDKDVREIARRTLQGDFHAVPLPNVRLHALMMTATDTIGRDHMEVALFVIAGLVLFLLMFRL